MGATRVYRRYGAAVGGTALRKNEAEGLVFKASRIHRLERALVGEGVRFNIHKRAVENAT